MTELRTARLRLRRAKWHDLAAVHQMLSDPRAMRYWSRPEHETLAETEEWLSRMIDRPQTIADDFLIEWQGQIVGKAGAWNLPEVGFLLHPDLWGQGFAREAMTVVLAHLFARPDVARLTAEADPRNAASLGLLRRLGFVETHRAERVLQWRDEWCDSVYFALEKADYSAA